MSDTPSEKWRPTMLDWGHEPGTDSDAISRRIAMERFMRTGQYIRSGPIFPDLSALLSTDWPWPSRERRRY